VPGRSRTVRGAGAGSLHPSQAIVLRNSTNNLRITLDGKNYAKNHRRADGRFTSIILAKKCGKGMQ
jgi:hypothetical protein